MSSHSAISAESNVGCLKGEKPAAEEPNKTLVATNATHSRNDISVSDKSPMTNANSGCLKTNIDFDNLVYPNCFYQETKGDPQCQQALKNDLRRIVASTIPFATIDEIQEILDDMDRINIRNMRNYFGKLCKDKTRGLFFPTELASKVKYHREESVKTATQQREIQQLNQVQQAKQQQEQQTIDAMQNYSDYIEKMVFETENNDELRQKLTKEYQAQAKVIKTQLNSKTILEPVIRLFIEKIATILITYAYNFNDTIQDACELRQKIIERMSEEKLRQIDNGNLWNTLNIPEMHGILCEEFNQPILNKG